MNWTDKLRTRLAFEWQYAHHAAPFSYDVRCVRLVKALRYLEKRALRK